MSCVIIIIFEPILNNITFIMKLYTCCSNNYLKNLLIYLFIHLKKSIITLYELLYESVSVILFQLFYFSFFM